MDFIKQKTIHCVTMSIGIANRGRFTLLQFVLVEIVVFMGLYAQIIASYYFAVNPFLNLTTQLD